MNLEIHRHHVHLDDDVREHIERRMTFALGQFDHWVDDVNVHVDDVNGQKGGVDKLCRVMVNLKSGKLLKVEDLDVDLTIAINRAADRISQVVSREVDRKRDRH